MKTISKTFSELTLLEYHRIMTLRVAVFVVEQNCPYQEIDETDLTSVHFWLEDAGEIKAYARIYEAAGTVHFGRVIVAPAARNQKLGTELLRQVLDWIAGNYPQQPIEIGAQAHLQKFYGQFGFNAISEIYLEDDIPHVDMRLEKSSPAE